MVEAASIPALTLVLLAGGLGGASGTGVPPQEDANPPAQAAPAAGPAAAAAADPGAKARPDAPATDKPKAGKKQGRRKAGCRVYTPPRYRKMAKRWQAVPRIPPPRYRAGYRDLVLASVNLGERVRVFPFLPDGTLDPAAAGEIERVMRDHHTDALHPVNPRLVKLLYRLADHFGARQITIVSGYRQPGDEAEAGHHGRGNAVDIALAGVNLPSLARFARQLGRVGVGLYPNAGFIHLDVRERSYFWVDRSGPGFPGCPARVEIGTAAKWERRWKPEDDEPVPRRDRHGALLGGEPAGSGAAGGPEPDSGF
jgi:uncharacterized protein YcbK (DUF882 family)